MVTYKKEDEDEMKKRRDLPPPGWKRNPLLLAAKGVDETLSSYFFLAVTDSSPLGQHRPLLCMVEMSAHFSIWFGGLILLMWFFSMDSSLRTFFFNVFIALVLDVLVVALLKATARRRRPGISREEYEADQTAANLSFPSGFTSRAFLVTLIVVKHSHLFPLFKLPFLLWCVVVAITKLLMGRQFLGDSLAGAFLGYAEYHLIVCPLWLSEDAVSFIFSFINAYEEYL